MNLDEITKDQIISPEEGKQLMADPAARQKLLQMPEAEQDRYAKMLFAGDPRIPTALEDASKSKAPMWMQHMKAKASYGLEPEMYDALLNAYKRTRAGI